MDRTYPGKIILFGEYTVVDGGDVLTIPLQRFYGEWVSGEKVDTRFQPFLQYLYKIPSLKNILHLDLFEKEISEALIFQSTIPIGYGAGSSGALVAAVFDRYKVDSLQYDVDDLKEIFACMESYFHGTSSGIDPLVSFLNRPIRIHQKTQIELIERDQHTLLNRFFLFDSKQSKSTEQYVALFRSMQQKVEFTNMLTELKEMVNFTINLFLTGVNEISLESGLVHISKLQYEWFGPMIPQKIKKLWAEGLESHHYYFKLCGSGGGGFFLVYHNMGFLPDECIRMEISS